VNYLENINTIIGAVTMVLIGITTICTFIKGEEPERTLNKIISILTKFSRKRK
jgi:putative Mn2+ efflux pump MntP